MHINFPTAILFDWDNTLLDSWGIIHYAVNNTLKEFGHTPRSLEQIKNNTYQSSKDLFPVLFGDQWEQAQRIFYDLIQEKKEHLQPLLGADRLIQHLYRQNIPLGIVSNKASTLLKKEIRYFGWSSIFHVVIGSGDAPKDKPDPEPILLALKQIHIKPNRHVWYVGDMEGDWECARAAGCQPIAAHREPTDQNIPFFKNCQKIQEWFDKN